MQVRVIMGSYSDVDIAKKVTKILKEFEISYEVSVISAHRALDILKKTIEKNDCKIYITIAGMAAHLGGVTAGMTIKPVIAVPVGSKNIGGMDALLSIVQMPKGIPVATVAIDGGENAAILAAEILALNDEKLLYKLKDHKDKMRNDVIEQNKNLEEI